MLKWNVRRPGTFHTGPEAIPLSTQEKINGAQSQTLEERETDGKWHLPAGSPLLTRGAFSREARPDSRRGDVEQADFRCRVPRSGELSRRLVGEAIALLFSRERQPDQFVQERGERKAARLPELRVHRDRR